MKNIVLATALSMSLAAPAFAETVQGNITDHFKTVVSQTPYNVEDTAARTDDAQGAHA